MIAFINYFKNIGTKNNFFLWIFLVALVPLFLISYTSSKISEESLEKEVVNNLSTVADEKVSLISLFLENCKKNIELFSHSPTLAEFIDATEAAEHDKGDGPQGKGDHYQRLFAYLSNVKDRQKYNDIMIVSNAGNVLFSLKDEKLVGRSVKEFAPDSVQLPIVFNNAVTLLDTQVSDFEKTPSLSTPQFYMASPIFWDGSMKGALIFSVGNEEISSIVNSRIGLGDTGEIVIGKFDQGKIIPQINLRHISVEDFLAQSQNFDPLFLAAFEQAAVKASKGEGTMKDYKGHDVVAVWQYLPAFGWGVMVKIDANEAFSPIGILKRNIFLLSVFILFLVFFAAYFVSKRFQKAEDKLTRMFADLKLARDQAMEADRTKSLFLANMSHELRTPLNAIIGYSEMLQEEAEEEGLDHFVGDLSRINGSGKHLLSLINDILDLSKIESGKMEIYLEEINVKEMVDNVMSIIRPLIDSGSNKLKVDYKLENPIWRTDVTKIRQCLLNLLSNANKFTHDGLIKLKIEQIEKDGDRFIQFDVIDTGIGMTEEQLGRLFQAFSQADPSTTRKYGGTGLGLLITKNFCQLMGGEISVKSVQDKGTTFSMIIPFHIPEPEGEKMEVIQNPSEVKSLTAIKLLIIDSEIKTHKNITENMKNGEFVTRHAYNGLDGLALCKQEKPDLIVLGVMMPKMDGWAVLAKLKEDPELKDVKVIMTSLASEDDIGMAMGATEVLSNPIQPIELVEKLKGHALGVSPKILVVEDDNTTRDLIVRALKKGNFQAMEAVNGQEAIEKISTVIPSIILLDLMMPKMDGFEVLNRLRANKDWCHIPVIIVTAKDLTEDDRNRLESATAIFSKGKYHHKDLLETVRKEIVSHSVSVIGDNEGDKNVENTIS